MSGVPQSLTALVVDDSAAMRRQLGQALQRSFAVSPVEAADGAEAWRKLAVAAYDIVITDINMPLMDGLKLIGLIRAQASPHRSMPIVVITTQGALADRDRAMALGANRYLVKPVQSQQVAQAVRELLRIG
jgi:two-component system, chemotaxis family, chemotaxis protein CheY